VWWVGDGYTGPSTGGMDAYSPAPVVTADIEQQVGIWMWDLRGEGCGA
jgi:phosphoribosylamine-glycine ligase